MKIFRFAANNFLMTFEKKMLANQVQIARDWNLFRNPISSNIH